MGMFDYVTAPEGIKCPACGTEQNPMNWQTKSNDPPQLERVEWNEVMRFYCICSNKKCREWIEFNRIRGTIPEVPGYEMTHCKSGDKFKKEGT